MERDAYPSAKEDMIGTNPARRHYLTDLRNERFSLDRTRPCWRSLKRLLWLRLRRLSLSDEWPLSALSGSSRSRSAASGFAPKPTYPTACATGRVGWVSSHSGVAT